jgi:FkbM family methyltransferase
MIDRLDGTLITTRMNGQPISFFVNSPNDYIQHHHFCGIFYEQEELNLIATRLKPKATFVDVGANVGNHSIYAAKILGAGLVIPFEVNSAVIPILRANLALNDCSNVDTRFIGWGLAAQDGMMTRSELDLANLGGTRFAMGAEGAFPSIKGDAVLSGIPIDFIKMDIEGMEMEALAGLAETIARWRPTIFIEIESDHLNDFGLWMQNFRYRLIEQFTRHAGRSNFLVAPAESA